MKVTTFRHGGQEITLEKGDFIKDMPHTGNGTPVGICPKCGQELVIRNGKYGKFIGCSGFKDGCRVTYKFDAFRALKRMTISLNRSKRLGHGFELLKSLHVYE